MPSPISQKLKKLALAISSAFQGPSSKGGRVRSPIPPIVHRQRSDIFSGASYDWGTLDTSNERSTLADLCRQLNNQLPIQLVKLVARDVLRELRFFHQTYGTAHGGLSLESITLSIHDMNTLVSQSKAELGSSLRAYASTMSLNVIITNFDCLLTSSSLPVFKLANFFSRHSSDIHRVESAGEHEYSALRPPELILGAPHLPSMDLWSLGCIIYRLLSGEHLFDPSFQTLELGLTPDESHIIQIMEICGDFPIDLIRAGARSHNWFAKAGTLKIDTAFYPETLEFILRGKVDEEQIVNAAAFLHACLQTRPGDRTPVQKMIDHPWFTN